MKIKELLKQKEGLKLEFKESLADFDEILKTICAFSNTKGGKIVVGVTNKGKVRGIIIGKGTFQDILNKIKFSIEPMIIPQIESVKHENKKLIVISVEEGFNKPYFYKGVAYKRVGASNQRIGKEELEKLIVKKYKEKVAFEDIKVTKDFSLINESLIKEFVGVVKEERKIDLKYTNLKNFLRKLGLIKNSSLTYASLLCFSNNPQQFLPYAIIKCGRFKNITSILAEREISGNLINQINLSLQFLRENLSFVSVIDEKGRRKEIYEIPLEALREAIVNAVCHRDYSIASPIYIKVFDDRVEIINPGKLPEPLTPELLKKEHESILRNPKIANVLFLYGFIERWGTGTNKIVEECLKHGLKEPEFMELGNFFKVVLFRKETEGVEKEILDLLEEKEMSSQEIAKKLKISERTARKYLKILVERQIIRKRRMGRKVLYSKILSPL